MVIMEESRSYREWIGEKKYELSDSYNYQRLEAFEDGHSLGRRRGLIIGIVFGIMMGYLGTALLSNLSQSPVSGLEKVTQTSTIKVEKSR